MKNMTNKPKTFFNKLVAHPYFGFILAGFLLMMVQVLEYQGVIGVTYARAFGLTIIYFIVSLGFSLLLGYAGLASLGTSGFIGLGAYITGYVLGTLNLPLFTALLLTLAIAVVIGTIVGFISLRIEGMYLAIITLGLSEILNEVFKNAVNLTGGVNGLRITQLTMFNTLITHREFYFVLVFVMVLAMILTINIISSPTGRAMLAMKNSTSAAMAMGISILKYRLLAFVIATIYAAVGGLLYFGYWLTSNPETWSISLSLSILAAVIVGGAKSIWGVLAGTFLMFGIDLAVFKQMDFFQKYQDVPYLFSGLLIILVVMFYPGGLSKLGIDIKQFFKKTFKKVKNSYRTWRYGEDDRQ